MHRLPLSILFALAPSLAFGTGTKSFSFSFGSAPPATGAASVTAASVYTPSAGFGFEPGAAIESSAHAAASAKPFLFSVTLPEGNYSVRVTLGSDSADSDTTIKAEARRLVAESIRVPRAQGRVVEFAVNVRTPRIDDVRSVRLKQREKDMEMVTWDDKLTLEFDGSHPALRALEISPAPAIPTVFIAGDSTVCDQPAEPWNSWGQMLTRFFKPGIAVANYAQSGESIKSSLAAHRFDKIFHEMRAGDWLLIQFGHNDMKDRASNALATYRSNLKSIVVATRAKGGIPVLVTSMERKAGVRGPTLAGYPAAVRDVAREEKAPLVDLNVMSLRLYQALGADLDRAFQDGTHHNSYGSYELAKCVAAGIAAAGVDLARYLADDVKSFDPGHPDPVSNFTLPPSPVRSSVKPDGN